MPRSQKPSFKTIYLIEIFIVLLMVLGIIPQEFSCLILVLLAASFVKLNILDSLKLFILSIPFFAALPANQFSDSMSIWRILILILVLKAGWEKYKKIRNANFNEGDIRECRLLDANWLKMLFNKKWFTNGLHSSTETMESAKHTLKNFPNPLCERGNFQKGSYYKLFLLTVLFFIIAVISLITAQDVGAGVKKILFLLNIFLLFPIVIFAIRNKRDLIEIMKFVFYSSAIIVFIGYIQFLSTFFIPLFKFWQFWAQDVIRVFYGQNLSNLLTFSNTWFSYYDILPPTLRMFSVMPDSHSFAMLAIISTPVILTLIFYCENKDFKKKKYLSIALIAFILAVFFSGSRGAWVSGVFALLTAIYLFLSSEKIKDDNKKFKIIKFKDLISFNLNYLRIRIQHLYRDIFNLLPVKLKISLSPNYEILKDKFLSYHFSKLIICFVLLFFILMPVSSAILKQNQEIQLMRSNIQLSGEEREKLNMFERALSISDFSETSNKGRFQIWAETITSVKDNLFFGIGFGNFPLILGENISALKKGSSAHCIYLDIMAETGIFGLALFLLLLLEILRTSYNLFFKLKTDYLKIFAGAFFVYFAWICAYGLFDVVIFNDKVLMFTVILTGMLYSINHKS